MAIVAVHAAGLRRVWPHVLARQQIMFSLIIATPASVAGALTAQPPRPWCGDDEPDDLLRETPERGSDVGVG